MILAGGKYRQLFLATLGLVVTGSFAQDGEWEGPFDMPLIPAASANLPDGRILAWSSNRKLAFGGAPGFTWTGIFDPATGLTDDARMAHTGHDMFCPGTAVLPDGRIMVTGGANAGTVSIFDSSQGADGEWVRGAPMNIGRGYHSSTLLANGSVLSMGGSFSGAGIGGRTGEVWSEAKGWTVKGGLNSDILATADRDQRDRDDHYWNFQAPNGLIYHAGPSRQMHWLTVEGIGGVAPSLARGDDLDSLTGSAVMFDIGKILKVGGAVFYKNGNAHKSTFVIDINGDVGDEQVLRSGDLNQARAFVNAVVLPTGEVLATGGATFSKIFSDDFAVMTTEIWNPATGTWKELSSQMKMPRTYHSSAVLMKDARVWVGGGGLRPNTECGAADHPNAEIFSPPYLFNADGSRATRPNISTFPTNVPFGAAEMKVTAQGGDELEFVIVRLGAATHSTNLGQRRIPLTLTGRVGNEYTLQLPTNSNVLIPGPYYMFALSEGRVPSLGETVVFMAGDAPIPPELPGPEDVFFDILLSTDLPGGNIPGADIEFPIGTELGDATDRCDAICARMPSCAAFTAVEENFFGDDRGPICYPKSTVPEPVESPELDGRLNSGVKVVEPVDPGAFDILLNTDLPGQDIRGTQVEYPKGTSLGDATDRCQEVCARMPNCAAFTAVNENFFGDGRGPICHPKSSIPAAKNGPQLNGRLNSGVKFNDPDPPPPSSGGFDILLNTDLPGRDIQSAIVEYPQGTSLDDATDRCETLCAELVACVAFTAVNENFFGDSRGPICHPKSSVPAAKNGPQLNGRLNSGVKNDDPDPPPPSSGGFDILLNTDLPGRDIQSAIVEYPQGTSLDDATDRCETLCAEMVACVAFTAVNENFFGDGRGPICHPKSSVPAAKNSPQLNGRLNSGVKNNDPDPSPPPPSSGGFDILLNTDLPGRNILSAIVEYPKGTSLDDATDRCQTLCVGLAACVAYTAVNENFFGDARGPICYPKSSVPTAKNSPQLHGRLNSGVKNNDPDPSPPPPSSGGFDILLNTDLPGRNILSAIVEYHKGTSLDDATDRCQTLCAGLAACVAYTAVNENFFGDGRGPICYSKSSVPPAKNSPQLNGRLNSGVKTSSPPSSGAFDIMLNTDLPGQDIGGAAVEYPKGTSLGDATDRCQALCAGMVNCAAYTAVNENFFNDGRGPICFPKSSVPTENNSPQLNGRLNSGVKKVIGRSSAVGRAASGGLRGTTSNDVPYSSIEYAKGTSLESATQQCEEACARMPDCIGITTVKENSNGNGLGPLCIPKVRVSEMGTH